MEHPLEHNYSSTRTAPMRRAMAGQTRVLLVSGDAEDAELIRGSMLPHGISVDILFVSTPGELSAALSFSFDVVVAVDSTLPLSIPAALHSVRASVPGVPFIVVADPSDCERAMRVVTQGATDVVWRDRLCRLGVSVSQALSARKDQIQKDTALADLMRYRERSEAIAAAVPGVIFQARVDVDGYTTFLFVSDYSEELLGVSPTRLRVDASALFENIHPEDRQRLRTTVQRARSADGLLVCEVRLLRGKDVRWLRCEARSDGRSAPAIWTGMISDITDKISYEQAMRKALLRAEEYNALKMAVLSNLSHEIRTPLTAIIGFADLLVSGETDSADLPEHASMIRENGGRLQETLDALLDLARLRSDREQVELKNVDIGKLTWRAASRKEACARTKGLEYFTSLPDESVLVRADDTALQRVVEHLIGNAIKFTSEGNVTVGLVVGRTHATIEIQDTGRGISPDFLPHVFDEFEQESKGLNREFNGVGIGLAVGRQLVEAMCGNIHIQSDKETGTLVKVSLPLAASLPGIPVKALLDRLEPAEDRRLLAVGLDEKNQTAMSAQLKGRAHIDFRDDLQEALSLLSSLIYDVVLLDLDKGSGEDELSAFRRVMNMPEYKGRPVVACTSTLVQSDLDRWATGGVTSFLPKPFSHTQLEERLGPFLS